MAAVIYASRDVNIYDADAVCRQAVEDAIAIYQIVKEDLPIEA